MFYLLRLMLFLFSARTSSRDILLSSSFLASLRALTYVSNVISSLIFSSFRRAIIPNTRETSSCVKSSFSMPGLNPFSEVCSLTNANRRFPREVKKSSSSRAFPSTGRVMYSFFTSIMPRTSSSSFPAFGFFA